MDIECLCCGRRHRIAEEFAIAVRVIETYCLENFGPLLDPLVQADLNPG